mgnify:FL=1|jgi:hypothetical protein|tara:strand:- start:722 stop:862 length:141 start_codon:yes stop_codon:yes gene_type:complete
MDGTKFDSSYDKGEALGFQPTNLLTHLLYFLRNSSALTYSPTILTY